MLRYSRYWRCRLLIRRLRSESEWESASAPAPAMATWLDRRFALTAITRTIRILAHPTATMARAGSRTGSLSAQAPGTTDGDIHIMDAPTVAALMADLRDADLRDADLRGVVLRGTASKGAAGARSSGEGSAVTANTDRVIWPSGDLAIEVQRPLTSNDPMTDHPMADHTNGWHRKSASRLSFVISSCACWA